MPAPHLAPIQEQPKEEEKKEDDSFLKVELSEEQKEELRGLLQKLIKDCEEEAEMVLKRLKVPIQNCPNKKHFELSQGMFKAIYDKRGATLKEFLDAVGFTALTPTKYIFQKPAGDGQEENAFVGNIRTVEFLTKLIDEEIPKLAK